MIHPILPVATAVAAFVDTFETGPMGRAVRVRSFAEFQEQFGGIYPGSEASYAVQQFFVNGGRDASIVRVPTSSRADLIGNPAEETGLFALVDDFNLLCLPATIQLVDKDAVEVAVAATSVCRDRRALYLLDVPQQSMPRDSPAAVTAWVNLHPALHSQDVAVYFPRVNVRQSSGDVRPTAASGTMAGLYARVDSAHGVWRAPAGTDAKLLGVESLEHAVTDADAGALGAVGVNVLRTFPALGTVAWGAHTFAGGNATDAAFRYVSARRLSHFVELSLLEGTAWVVLEHNAAPLWAEIRQDVTAFMQSLFTSGAFQGRTPREAYFVKCDAQTTTVADISLGVVNVVVGFAPLKPAEFVILEIQQRVTPEN